MLHKIGVGIVIIALLSGGVWAAVPEDAVRSEFWVGTLTGYAVGIGGLFGVSAIVSAGCGGGWECFGRAILGALIGYTGGSAVGASLGVWATGNAYGVDGNVTLCFLGGMGGAATSAALGLIVGVPELLVLVPPAAAAGATAGFNVGAELHRR